MDSNPDVCKDHRLVKVGPHACTCRHAPLTAGVVGVTLTGGHAVSRCTCTRCCKASRTAMHTGLLPLPGMFWLLFALLAFAPWPESGSRHGWCEV
jgi:hypothetical protein